MDLDELKNSQTFSILCYHGVYPDDTEFGELNSSGKHVSESVFEAQIASLVQNHTLISMSDIVRAYLAKESIPNGAVAVTFDDGFHNNVANAWPILEKYGVPATVYLATGYIGSDRVMRMDTIEAIVFLSGLPKLVIEVGKEELSFDLDTMRNRRESFFGLKKLCKELPRDAAEKMIIDLSNQAPRCEIFQRPEYRFMTWEDARKMAQSELIELGAHTVDHFPLSTLDQDEIEYQIKGSIQAIESELNQRCIHFAYPEGRACDYDQRAIDFLIEEKIFIAPNAVAGTNLCYQINPYHLNRILVGMDGNLFPF